MLRVLGNRVVLKPCEAEDKTPGGVILPDTAKERPLKGVVIAIGPGIRLENGMVVPPDVKVGETVVYRSFAGFPIKDGDEEYIVINENDILAVIEEGNNGS